ncbi:hypothetical protein [Clostridium botulinum]|uniref:Uncharacterized protein n=1 Tax=Clostridium botulinum TaxID=1491 RepID=A0A9Q1UXI2_CLOBO|nr:hypothetical protein [Clostridium botulinum]AEB77472.1 hypothetical protein CbC4_5051 [Clostridium botulinum BKT015925]KEH96061.1 hypothetical protein Y848_p0049 [Clostridium botulinum C/D str. Sp77]KEH96905.1 hypothetical protein Z953_13665 [Clostridium botulinum D str. 16868]KLU74636.1 hypothetical protein CBC3_13140 [Clostridium botulinum V891]KOA75689.1 hypothetical protein ADU77_10610 [Clostridium botulinum]
MNEQTILLFLLIFCTVTTLFLYIWKANRHVYYRNDERWSFIQNKANNVANYSNQILIVFVAVVDIILLFFHIEKTFTLNRILTYAIIFIGLRNTLELFALKYLDKRI